MRKQYLTDLLRDEVDQWGSECIVIDAPTGSGKTTFVIETLIERFAKYEALTKRKILILCNRRLLRQQYWTKFVERYARYSEIKDKVRIRTYQELEDSVEGASSVNKLFDDVCAVICDEFHYFYADSDFNSLGTYPLLNAIVRAGAYIPIFFLSATTSEIMPLLKETAQIQQNLFQHDFIRDVDPRRPNWDKLAAYSRPIDGFKVMHHKFPSFEDYGRFECYAVSDDETLCQMIERSSGKTLIFIDNRKEAESIKNLLIEVGVEEGDIAVLNADNIDNEKMSKIIDHLVYTNKLFVRVLITTSVLDNGVSVLDPDVENVVIITESRISFLQMLGRVRAGEEERMIRLIFKVRDPDVFRLRVEKYKRINAFIGEIQESLEKYSSLRIIQRIWHNADPEMFEMYRAIFCPLEPDNNFMPDDRAKVVSSHGLTVQFKGNDTGFYLNRFAVEKIGNMQICEENFYRQAMINPLNVIYTQMEWIDKKPEDLHIVKSVVEKEFVEEALKIQGLDSEQFQNKKRDLVKRFKHYIFKDLNTKNGTVSNEKFESVLKQVGLVLRVGWGEKRKNRYFVERQENAIEDEKGGQS